MNSDPLASDNKIFESELDQPLAPPLGEDFIPLEIKPTRDGAFVDPLSRERESLSLIEETSAEAEEAKQQRSNNNRRDFPLFPASNFTPIMTERRTTEQLTGTESVNSISLESEPLSTQANTIEGTSGRDSLTGTSEDDLIVGGFGADTISGGGGSDTFVYNNIRDSGDLILDFELNRDKIDLSGVLASIGYLGNDPLGDGYVELQSYSQGTVLLLDLDGPGGTTARPYLRLFGVTPEQLASNPNHIYPHPEDNLPLAPEIVVPGLQEVAEDENLIISGIFIDDEDGSLGELEVNLSVNSGVVSLRQTTGLTLTTGTGSRDSSLVFRGTLAAVNGALSNLVYQGNPDFNGDDALVITVTDLGNTTLTDTETVAISVNPVNDAPVLTVPGTQIVAEDRELIIGGISLGDVDSSQLEVTLTADEGTLGLSQTTGLSFTLGDGTADSSLTFTGSITALNNALAGLVYRGNNNFNGNDEIVLTVSDGTLSDTATIPITVTPVNDAPVLTVPDVQTVAEDENLTITGISVSDVDVGSGDLEVTVSANNGVLSLSQTTGLTFSTGDGAQDSTLTFTGTLADVNDAIASLTYRGNPNFNGNDSISITVSDLGNTGAGGALSDNAVIPINVTSVNNAPTLTIPEAQTVAEDENLTLAGITVSDLDSSQLNVTLTAANGVVSLSQTNGLTLSEGDGLEDSTIVFTGSVIDINNALAGLVYRGNADFNGEDGITVTVSDGEFSDSQTIPVTVTPVNDAPILTVPVAQTVAEDTDLAITGISVSDLDVGSGDLEGTLTVGNGVLSLSQTTGLSFTTGDGTEDSTVTFTGTLADVNSAIASLTYRSNPNFNGNDSISVTVSDLGNTGAGGILTDTKAIAINVTSVNNAPTLTIPDAQTVAEDESISITGIEVADIDSNQLEVNLTVNNGVISLNSTEGLTITTGDGLEDSNLTLTGSVADINNALTGLVYRGNADFNGDDAIAITVSDGEFSDSQTIRVTLTPINDAPILTVPTLQTVAEDENLTITGITISDIDVGSGNLEVTLTVGNGVLSLSQTTGLTFTNGNGVQDSTLTFTGTLADLNNAIASLTYRGNPNFNGNDSISITVRDLGNTGEGGELSDTATIDITVIPVNSPPIADPDKFLVVPDDGSVIFLNINAPTDPDGDALTITVDEIPAADKGTVRLADSTVVEVGRVLTISDLEGLQFIPVAGETGLAGSFSYTVDDGQGGTDSQTITFNITPVIILLEGNSFKVSELQAITIPSQPSVLRFTYSNLSFDTTDADFINDAFEAALVDGDGNSLVHTIGEGKDSFFNLTEDNPAALAPGVTLDGQTVSVNLAGVEPGTTANLILRLVNDDGDITTTVRISDIAIETVAELEPPQVTPDAASIESNEPIDFDRLSDVSSSIRVEYGQTSFNESEQILFADVTLQNIGTYGVNAPLLVAVNNLSDPTVTVVNADGLTPDGLPYFDFSDLVSSGKLEPSELTASKTLNFRNPSGAQFTYELVVLSELNSPPVIESNPNLEIIGGLTYSYDVNATDADGDSLTYELLVAPQGMSIDATTGQISWDTTVADIANHDITVRVSDGRGGVSLQNFVLSVIEEPPNRPPIFTTTPVVDAFINQLYRYDANAIDPDLDPLSFSLILGPEGMRINSETGIVEWTPPPALVLGDTVLGRIGLPGENDEFTFSGVLGQQIYFDPLQFTGSSFNWNFDVYAPSGQQIVNSDLQSFNNQLVKLTETGNYRIVVDANNDVTGSYGFSVIDLNLTPIAPFDTVIEGQLSPGSEDDIFRFTGNAGQKLFFDSLNSSGSLNWILYGPDNKIVTSFSSSSFSDQELYLPTDGEYKLAIRGTGSLTNITTYAFEIITPDEITKPMSLGSNDNPNSVFGEISEKGEEDFYTFEGSVGQRIYFDRLFLNSSFSSSHTFTLISPSGQSVLSRNFNQGDATAPISLLEDGTYRVRIDASGEATGSYSFSLLDVNLATPIDLDTQYSGTLDVGEETHLYQFEGTAGQRIFIDTPGGIASGTWTLYNSGNQQVASNFSLNSDIEIVLNTTDTYILAIKGNNGSNPINYSFEIITPDIITETLALDTDVISAITEKGERDIYTFTGSLGQRLFLDTLIDRSDFFATLVSPSGQNLINSVQMGSDGSRTPVLLPEAGTYELIIDGSGEATGNYGFSLIDVGAAPVLEMETLTGGVLDPGKSIQFYQFTGNQGQRIYFDNQANSPGASWYLFNGSNNRLTSASLNDFEYVLPADGTYYLMLVGESNTPIDYNIQLVATTPAITPLTLNSPVVGEITKLGEQDIHTFEGTVGQTLYFDARNGTSNLSVTLNSPSGKQVLSGNASTDRAPITLTEPGTYQLIVDGSGDATGEYGFVVSDTGASLSFGAPLSGNLNARETILYQFNGTAGQRLEFDSLSNVSGADWVLYAPTTLLSGNNTVGSAALSSDFTVTLPVDGSYLLALRNSSDSSVDYDIQVNDISPEPLATDTFGDALSLNGINDYVEIPDTDVIDFDTNEDFTVESWIQVDAIQSDTSNIDNDIIEKWSGLGGYPFIIRYLRNTGKIVAARWDLINNPNILSTTSFNDGTFHHVAFVKEGEILSLYVDGQLEGTTTDTTTNSTQNTSPLYLGRRGGSNSNNYFAGHLDEVRIWNTARTQAEIQANLNRELTGTETGLVGYWNFNNNISGNTVPDVAGNDNNGTLFPLPLDLNIQNDISLNPFETKAFKFTGRAGQKIWFDGLNISNPNVTIRLLNSSGRQITSTSDSRFDIGLQTLEADGEYYLVLQSNNSAATTASFQLHDVSGATPLTFDTEIAGNFGTTGREARLYRFTGTEGQRLYFDVTQGDFNNFYYLYSPGGQQVFSSRLNFGSGASFADFELAALPGSGEYTLVVSGLGAANNNYNLRVVTPEFVTSTLTIGETITNNISEAGEQDTYTFEGTVGQQLWFDSLINSFTSSITGTLYAPSGSQLWSQSFSGDRAPTILTETGTYRFVVDGSGDATGAYGFRFLDLAEAAPVSLDSEIAGNFGTTGREARLYRFIGTEGQRLYFDVTQGDFNNFYYLYSPGGQQVFSSRLNFGSGASFADFELAALPGSGEYTLVVSGLGAANNNYNLRVVTPEFVTSTLTIGETITNNISEAGERDTYTFEGTVGQKLWLDELVGNSNVTATLYNPSGNQVFSSTFGSYDDTSNPGVLPLLTETGTYKLVVDGSQDATGTYSFRLLDVANATTVNLDTEIRGDFGESKQEAHLYRFSGTGGQRLYFDQLEGDFSNYYYLYNPAGQRLFFQRLNSDFEGVTLATDGEYTLVFQSINSASNNNYALKIVTPEFTTEPLTLGETITNNISEAGERDTYTFEGTVGQKLWLDELIGNSNVTATLYSPSGNQVFSSTFGSYDDTSNSGVLPVLTQTGTYRLVVDASLDNTGTYSFRLLDVAEATTVNLDTEIRGDFGESKQEAHLYRFSGTGGQRLYFDQLEGDFSNYYYLYNPAGQRLFFQRLNSDFEGVTLASDGEYTLVFQSVNFASNNNYALKIVTPEFTTTPLTLGETVSNEIGEAGEQDTYTFEATVGQQLFFDALVGNSSLDVKLYSPSGNLVIDLNTVADGTPFTLTEAGTHRLVIDGVDDTIGNYSFRLSDRALVTPLELDTAIAGTLEPGNEVDLYQFTGTRGTILSFNLDAAFWSGANWVLYDPNNGVLAQPASSSPDFEVALPSDGLYTLAIAGTSTTTVSYSFQVTENSVAPIPTTGTNITVTGTVANGGEVDSYTFEASAGTLIWLDQLSSTSSNLRARLKNPDGTFAFTNHFTTSDRGAILLKQTGEYTLETYGSSSSTTGSWQFQVLEMPTNLRAPGTNYLEIGSVVSGTLESGEARVYTFAGINGLKVLYNGISGNGVNTTLYDPNGNQIFSSISTSDSRPYTLTQDGTYQLVIYGSSGATRNYSFQLLDLISAQELTYSVPTSGFLNTGQEGVLYKLQAEKGERLFLDLLATNAPNSNYRWKLYNAGDNQIFDAALNQNGEVIIPETGEYYLYIQGSTNVGRVDYEFRVFPYEQDLGGQITPGSGEGAAIEKNTLGLFAVQLEVRDNNGGTAIQDYQIRLRPDPTNGNPVIISQPETIFALDTQAYRYQLNAIDPDNDALIYQLTEAPLGALINNETGELLWYPENTVQPGERVTFSVEVSDRRGGTDIQTFTVDVFSSLGTIRGAVFDDLNGNGFRDTKLIQGDNPTLLFAIDVSGSTAAPFKGKGEYENVETVVDAEVAAALALLDAIVAQGAEERVEIGLMIFGSTSIVQDMNPTTIDLDPYTTALTDADGNGIPDVREILQSLTPGMIPGGTDINQALTTVETLFDVLPGDPNFIFMSDGYDTEFDPELAANIVDDLEARGGNITAFAIGEASTTETLEAIDPNAIQVIDINELVDIFFGFDDRYAVEPFLEGVTVYLDSNNNGVLDNNEPFQITKRDTTFNTLGGTNYYYTFDNLLPGTYTVRIDVPNGSIQTAPSQNPIVDTITVNGEIFSHLFGISNVDQNPPNQAPTFISTPPVLFQVQSGDLLRYDADARDADADTLTYELVFAPDGMTIDPETGIVVWLPTEQQVADYYQELRAENERLIAIGRGSAVKNTLEFNVLVTVDDGRGGKAFQNLKIELLSDNIAPVFTSIPPENAKPQVGKPFQYQAKAIDADGDTLTYQLVNAPNNVTIDAATGLINWTPTSTNLGEREFQVKVTDGKGGEALQELNFNVIQAAPNNAPNITSNPPIQARVNNTYVYQVGAEDIDGDPLSFNLTDAPDGMTIDARGRITWNPVASQLGSHTVEVTVADGQGGSATQSFTLNVNNRVTNTAPSITSTPNTVTNTERVYQYRGTAVDPDEDYLIWSLAQAPQGMVIDEETGVLSWQPTAQQIGEHTVSVRVIDPLGLGIIQTFTLSVSGNNIPPAILSIPPTRAGLNQPYTYQVAARDPENDPLRFSLGVRPEGMTIDETTGEIQWTPTSQQLGSHTVEVIVADTQNGVGRQTYTLEVGTTAINRPPTINSQPSFFADVTSTYTYNVRASDPEEGTLTYSLLDAPSGMTIDADTGLIQWNPTSGQLGVARVSVAAFDPSGLGAVQTYSIQVQAANNAPIINSNPVLSAVPGTIYRYDVRANDPDREAIAYRLTQAPEGMSIDQLGRITWTPGSGDVGNYEIEIVVTDSRGASATQSYNLIVAADTTAPLVNLQFNRDRANIGDTVTFQVTATDNVGVEELRLTFNGENIALDGNGRATVEIDSTGSFEVVAFATDAAGNRGEDTTTVFGIDPSDNQAPVVAFSDLTEPVEITSPLDIVGTITDDNLLFYTLAIAPVGSNNFTEIARGTEPVSNGFLGQLDPAILSNDAYTLRLFALDAGGNQSVIETEVSIAGELKLGNFQLSFTDLSIPVSGIPIILTRTYDTLNANNNDDFGYGWRMEIRDTDLRTSVGKTGLEDQLIYNPYFAGARVYVTTPGGKREGFTFEPRRAPGLKGSFLGIWEAVFVPDAGVTSSLTVEKFDLLRTSTGEFLGYGSSLGYNPSSPAFGGTFTLTTKEGIVYKIDGNTGDTRTVSDRNGNVLTFTDAGIFSNSGQKITFERNPRGQITAAIDPEGNRIEYEYDANGDLVAVTDREGNVTRFDYNDNREHYLEEVIDPLGRTGARSEYDERGRLIKIIDADGKAVELIHDPNNFTETVKDQLGNETIYEYDERGNVVTEIDAEGGVTRRTYNDPNNPTLETSITDPLGNTTTFTYDARGNVLTETDPLGNVTRFTYDSFGNVLTTTDPQGNTTINTYDRNGNLTSISGQTNGKTTLNYDARGNLASFNDGAGTTRFEYDAAGNVTRQVDAAGNVTTFTYDASGNQLSETRTLTTPNGVITLVTTTEYDSEGRVIKVTNPEGGVTETIYDAVGNRIEEIDPLGRSTKFIYDERGLLVETIYPDSTPEDDLDNPRTKTEYDAAGQVITEIDELGRKTQFVYDKLGRVVETIRPDETPNDDTDNPRTRTEYDAAGRVIAEIDERGNRTEFVYDKAGRQIATILPDETPNDNSDNPRITTTYDTAGRQRTQTDALGNVTEFFYDDLGRPVGQKFADGTTVSSQFDESGRLIVRTDQDGEVTRFEYDTNGRLTAVLDALNQRTEYGYDEQGNLISQKDARGNITKYEYDGLGRRIATVLPGGQRSTSEYDAVGNVIRTTDFNGETITYEYDERNRLIAENFPDGSSTTYTYDLVGQRKTVIDTRGTTTYEYDAEGFLIKRIDPDGKEIAYTYDDAGNRTSVEIASGNTAYTYDELNRLKTVIDPDGGITSYFYNDNSNLIRTQFPNGTVETREYDSLNRLTYIETKDINGDIISSFRYELDAEGNRTQVTEHNGRIVKYYYDDLDRLEKEEIFDPGATEPTRTIEYAYDEVGNRLSRVDSGEGTTIYTYDNNDRLLTETTDGVATTYTYDNNGNTISKNTGSQTVTYEWDAENRLVGADTDGDGTVDLTNQYDADGVRVAQTVNGEETRFLIDTNRPYAQVVEEYTPGGIIKVSYVYGNDLISQERDEQQSFYHVDGLGSTRALSDESGLATDRYIYDAFGRVLTKIGDTDNSYLFAGEQRDSNLGLDYLRARYLDVDTGRFVSRDLFPPVSNEPLSLNRYIYAIDNPVNRIDPNGLISFSLSSITITVATVQLLTPLQFVGGVVFSEVSGEKGLVGWKGELTITTGATSPGIFGGAVGTAVLSATIGSIKAEYLIPLVGLSLTPNIPFSSSFTEGTLYTPSIFAKLPALNRVAFAGFTWIANLALGIDGGVGLTQGVFGFGYGDFGTLLSKGSKGLEPSVFKGTDLSQDILVGSSFNVSLER